MHVVLRLLQSFGAYAERAVFILLQVRAHARKQVPAFSFLALTNPGVVVSAEPCPREEDIQFMLFGIEFEVLGWSDRLKRLAFRQFFIKGMEEFLTVVIIVFPCVFAVHDDSHDVRTFAAFQAFVNRFQRRDHILRGCLTRHARVIEPDLVRDYPVAEKNRYFLAALALHVIGTVESVRILHYAAAFTGKAVPAQPEACHEHRLAGLHPLVASLADQRHDLLRNGTFSGP